MSLIFFTVMKVISAILIIMTLGQPNKKIHRMITCNSIRLLRQQLFVEGRRLQDELKGQGRVVIDGHVVPDLVDAAIIETVKVRRHQGVTSSLVWLYYPRSFKSS